MALAFSATLKIFLRIPVFRAKLTTHHMEKSDPQLAGPANRNSVSSDIECSPCNRFVYSWKTLVIVIQNTVSEVHQHLYTVLSELSL